MSKITHTQALNDLDNIVDYVNDLIEKHNLSGGLGNWYLNLKKYINQQKQTPLIHFEDANHFRNTFYNAPIGTVENEIANKLNELIEFKRYFDLEKLSSGMYWNGTDEEWEEYKKLKEKLSKVDKEE